MKISAAAHALVATLIGLSLTGAPRIALADIKDYQFELVQPTIQSRADRIVTVRLINKATGKPVPDAVIFATRPDMA